jgi:hypothetical protein
MLSASIVLLSWARRTLTATRHSSNVTRHTSHVTRHTSYVTRHTSHVKRHTHVTRHTSKDTRQKTHVPRHTSHVTRTSLVIIIRSALTKLSVLIYSLQNMARGGKSITQSTSSGTIHGRRVYICAASRGACGALATAT